MLDFRVSDLYQEGSDSRPLAGTNQEKGRFASVVLNWGIRAIACGWCDWFRGVRRGHQGVFLGQS